MLNAFQYVAPRSRVTRPSKPQRQFRQSTPWQQSTLGTPKIDLGLHGAPRMKQSRWQSGDAPHVGWWLTKVPNDGDTSLQAWRWRDGSYWSCPMRSGASARLAAQAAWQASYRDDIRWSYDWPAGTRVQRVNPLTGEVTGG